MHMNQNVVQPLFSLILLHLDQCTLLTTLHVSSLLSAAVLPLPTPCGSTTGPAALPQQDTGLTASGKKFIEMNKMCRTLIATVTCVNVQLCFLQQLLKPQCQA